MRVAALYDIHSNLPALEAVMADIRRAGVDLIVIGGDVIPGPFPRETLRYLLNLDIPIWCLHGNGEREVLETLHNPEDSGRPAWLHEILRWTGDQLEPELVSFIAGWPSTLRLHVEGLGDVLFCHASPRNDTDIFTRLTPEERLIPLFEGLNVSLVVCGHTHMQYDRLIGATRVVNAGSVGMPFGKQGADWLLFDPGVTPRHTGYDLEAAAALIRQSSYPQAQKFADEDVLKPRSEATALEAMARIEIR